MLHTSELDLVCSKRFRDCARAFVSRFKLTRSASFAGSVAAVARAIMPCDRTHSTLAWASALRWQTYCSVDHWLFLSSDLDDPAPALCSVIPIPLGAAVISCMEPRSLVECDSARPAAECFVAEGLFACREKHANRSSPVESETCRRRAAFCFGPEATLCPAQCDQVSGAVFLG